MRKKILIILLSLSAFSVPLSFTHASDIDSAAFSLRFPIALSRFSSYGDVAGVGGASVASQYSSSINPASQDWKPNYNQPLTASMQYSVINSELQNDIDVAALALSYAHQGMGSMMLAGGNVRQDTSLQGDYVNLSGDFYLLQWGKRFSDDFSFGLAYNRSEFDSSLGLAGFRLGSGVSKTDTYRTGVLMSLSEKLLLGTVIEYSETDASGDVFINPLGYFDYTDSGYGKGARVGLSYEYQPLSSVYADFSHTSMKDTSGNFDLNLLQAGVEHELRQGVFARAGLAYDTGRSNTGQSIGLGFYPADNYSVDIAWQHNWFPELKPDFGDSEVFNISISLLF